MYKVHSTQHSNTKCHSCKQSNFLAVLKHSLLTLQWLFLPNGEQWGVKCLTGIVIDEEGCSFVAEGADNCVSIFDPQGNKVHTVGNLNDPRGIILGSKSGSLYVANCCDNTVLKYSVYNTALFLIRWYLTFEYNSYVYDGFDGMPLFVARKPAIRRGVNPGGGRGQHLLKSSILPSLPGCCQNSGNLHCTVNIFKVPYLSTVAVSNGIFKSIKVSENASHIPALKSSIRFVYVVC